MTPVARSTNGSVGGPGPEGSSGELDLWTVLEIVRRHLWFIVVLAVVGAGLGAWYSSRQVDTYTAEAVVRKLSQVNPVSNRPLDVGARDWSTSPMESEVELLNSGAVLEPAVARLVLPLRLPDHPELRESLLDGARVFDDIASGDYILRPGGSGLQLARSEGGEIIAEGAPGEVLAGPGFEIPVREATTLSGEGVPLASIAWVDAVDQLRGGVVVTRAEYTDMIRLRFTATSAEFAADVVNAVADAYRERAEASVRESATLRREFLANQLAAVADSVENAQAALADFQQSARILDPTAEGTNLATELRAEELEVRQLRYQRGLLESLVTGLGNSSADDGLERIITLSGEMVPGAETAYARLRTLQDERRRLTADRFGYREGSSRVAVVDSLILGALQELRGLAQEALSLTTTRLTESQSRVSEIRAEVGTLPAQASEMTQLEQRAEAVLRNFDVLTERYYEAQISEAVASADVEIVDYARPPPRPDGRSTVLPVLLAGMLGLGAGVLGAVARETLDKTIRRPGDAESATGLVLLGMVPLLESNTNGKGAPPPLVVRQGHHGGPAAEAFKALPAILRYANAGVTRTIAVTSQGPKEGKSFTASNLALALARSGSRTLLIDCDLHRPRIAPVFEVNREPGLAEYLTQQAPYAQCLRELVGENLWVIPAGGRAPDPARLIGSPRFRDLVEQVRDQFEAVVLDTPPVLAVSEVLEIVRRVEGVVLVARAEQTNRLALAEAADRLRKVDAPLLGLILNGVKSGAGQGYGGYYYRYYTYDYKEDDPGARRGRRR